MDNLNARPILLKQANLSLIRRVLREKNTATRAEISAETEISPTTVRSLLCEMLQDGELISSGYDESCGGRKAERYRFNPEHGHCAAFCVSGNHVYGMLVNIYGEIVEKEALTMTEENLESAVFSFLDKQLAQRKIRSVGIGVPGIVNGLAYWRKEPQGEQMLRMDIGSKIFQKYKLPVILENDLNATIIGFARCYAKNFPFENPEKINMAYLHFESRCVSAGFIVDGRVIRGFNNYCGELSLLPIGDDGRYLDELLSEPLDDSQYAALIIKIIMWICGILNPQYIALGGPAFRENCIDPVSSELAVLLPKHMSAEILYAPDVLHDYRDGMAFLTAEKMFEEIQFIKK